MQTKRIIFMGTPAFAVAAFDALLAAGHRVAAAYTRPPARAGRGKPLVPSPVQQAAEAANVPVSTALDDPAPFADADVAVVAAYGHLLPPPFLAAPRLGCWNIHASLLPRWRGAAPIQRAIQAGDTQTGISIMRMEKGLDTGAILLARPLTIAPDDTAGSLHDKLAHLGGQAIVEALESADTLTPTPQPETGITYAKKIDKAETRLDWQHSAADLAALVRALSPTPGAWFEAAGGRVKVLSAQAVALEAPTGTLCEGAIVACGEGGLKLVELQRAGGKPMEAAAFLRGARLAVGAVLA